MNMPREKHFLLALLFSLASSASAFVGVLESGELVQPGQNSIGLAPIILTSDGGGTTINTFFDTGINDSTSARLLLGVGAIDFNLFASAKYIPFPDVDDQPAIGFKAGVGVARDAGINLLNFQFAPLVSKKVEIEDFGYITPYVSIPLTYTIAKDENFFASNFTIGTEARSSERPELNFGGELSFDMNKSYSTISVFVSYPFDYQGR